MGKRKKPWDEKAKRALKSVRKFAKKPSKQLHKIANIAESLIANLNNKTIYQHFKTVIHPPWFGGCVFNIASLKPTRDFCCLYCPLNMAGYSDSTFCLAKQHRECYFNIPDAQRMQAIVEFVALIRSLEGYDEDRKRE